MQKNITGASAMKEQQGLLLGLSFMHTLALGEKCWMFAKEVIIE